jgi:hypothetical protein
MWIIATLASLAASGLWVLRRRPSPQPEGRPLPLAAHPGFGMESNPLARWPSVRVHLGITIEVLR